VLGVLAIPRVSVITRSVRRVRTSAVPGCTHSHEISVTDSVSATNSSEAALACSVSSSQPSAARASAAVTKPVPSSWSCVAAQAGAASPIDTPAAARAASTTMTLCMCFPNPLSPDTGDALPDRFSER
jgi:hypothetical protein